MFYITSLIVIGKGNTNLPMTNYHHLISLNHFVQENLYRLHIVIFAALLSTFQE